MKVVTTESIDRLFKAAYAGTDAEKHMAISVIEQLVHGMIAPGIENIELNTQDHHNIKEIITLQEAIHHGCGDPGLASILMDFSDLLEDFLTKLPAYLEYIGPKAPERVLASALQAETEIISYCNCCGMRLHYQYDYHSKRIDIAAHQHHQLAETGRDAGCQYNAKEQLQITLSTPSKGVVVTKDIRNILGSNTTRLISEYLKKHNLVQAGDVPSKQQRREISKFLTSLKMAYFYCGGHPITVNVFHNELTITPEGSGLDDREIIYQDFISSGGGVCVFDYDHFVRIAYLHFGSMAKAIRECEAVSVDTGLDELTLSSNHELDGQDFAIRGTIQLEVVEQQAHSHR